MQMRLLGLPLISMGQGTVICGGAARGASICSGGGGGCPFLPRIPAAGVQRHTGLSLSHILRSSSRRGWCCCCIADRWTHTTIIMFQSSFGAFTLHTHITALKIRDQTSQYMAKKNADRPAATETLSPSSAAKHKLCDMDPPATCVCASEF
jgi:hypothetical protein